MQPEKPVVTHDRLVAGFGELGLAPGALVMVHSSLSAFGHVEGGAETVIAALLEAIAPDGTLVLPTLCQRDKERREETWDIARSPSDVGKITEVFRTWNPHPPSPSPMRPAVAGRGGARAHLEVAGLPSPGARNERVGRGAGGEGKVVRSDHFTHSVAALGPLAEQVTSGHATAHGRPGPWGERAFGHGSPWEKLVERNALYCFLGVSFRVHTLRHFIQSLLLEDTIARLRPPAADELRAQAAGWNKPGLFPWWNGEQEEEALAALGLIRYVEIGAAMCRSIPARTDVDTLLQLIGEQPEQWLNPEFLPWYRQAMAARD